MTQLILLRHGDRNHGFGDVPLSEIGMEQAQKLANNSLFLKTDTLLSSPKLRAQQTIQPLSEKLQKPIELRTELDQRRSTESAPEFTQRVSAFMQFIADNYPQKTVLVATHSDWLQMAILQLNGDPNTLALHSFFGCADFLALTNPKGFWEIHD